MKKKPKVVETHPKNPKMNSDAVTAVIGIDLGDKRSAYCIVDMNGSVIGDGAVATTAEALRAVFGATGRMRIALECGTHSPWVSRILEVLGHEVIVANPRRLRLISESDRKNDKADARTLTRLAQAAPDLLAPVHHRSEQVQLDLATIKARDAAVRSRTALISAIRGITKSSGSRAATWPEPVREAFEVHLISLVENGHHGLLNNIVLPASVPKWPRRSRGLPVLVHVVSQRARVLRLRRIQPATRV